MKDGYGKERKVFHVLTDLYHYYCFQIDWRLPNYLTIVKFQHLICDITKVEDTEQLLQFMTEQISGLLGKISSVVSVRHSLIVDISLSKTKSCAKIRNLQKDSQVVVPPLN